MKQERVDFYGTKLLVVMSNDDQPMVSLRHVCDGIGVMYTRQLSKAQSNPVLTCTHMCTTGRDAKEYKMLCIPLNQLNGFLFSINANKVKAEIRDQLIKYQQECFDVLYKHFALKAPSGTVDGISAAMIMDKLNTMDAKLDHFGEVDKTVFGDVSPEIEKMIELMSNKYQISKREVWNWMRKECDVGSYKKQNRRLLNWLRVKLGKGIKLLKGEENE